MAALTPLMLFFTTLSTRVVPVLTLSHVWNWSTFISLLACVNMFIHSRPISARPSVRESLLIPGVSPESL